MATLALTTLTGLLECAVCLDEMRDPRILNCGHIMCLDCIKKLLEGKKKEKKVKCPTCRKSSKIEKNVKDLPKAFVVKDMQDRIKKLMKEKEKEEKSAAKNQPSPAISPVQQAVDSGPEGWASESEQAILSDIQARREQEERDRRLAEELQRQEDENESRRQTTVAPNGQTTSFALYPAINTFVPAQNATPSASEVQQGGEQMPWRKYNLQNWPFSDLRDNYNTSTDLEFMLAIREEIERRTAAYTKWKSNSMQRQPPSAKCELRTDADTDTRKVSSSATSETAILASNSATGETLPISGQADEICGGESANDDSTGVGSLQNPLYDTADNVMGLEIKDIEQYLEDNKAEIKTVNKEELEQMYAVVKKEPKAQPDKQPGAIPPPLPPPRKRSQQPTYENTTVQAPLAKPGPPPLPVRPSIMKLQEQSTPNTPEVFLKRERKSQKETVVIPSPESVDDQFVDHTPIKRAFSKHKSFRIKPPDFSGKPSDQKYFRIAVMDQEASKSGERKIRGWWLAHFDGPRVARQLDTHLDFEPVLRLAGVDDKTMCELCLEETGLLVKVGAEVTRESFEKEWNKCNGDEYVEKHDTKITSPYLRSILKVESAKTREGVDLESSDKEHLIERL